MLILPQPISTLEQRWTKVNDVCIHSYISIAKPNLKTKNPLVLVHGLGVSSRYMLPTANLLNADYKVLVPDLPGFGLSTKPRAVLNIPQLADALVNWLKVLKVAQASFLANSLGCQVIVDLAVRYPTLVDRLVLIGPTVDPYKKTAWREIWRLMKDIPGEPVSQLRIAFEDYLRCGPRRMLGTLGYALQDQIQDKLPLVNAPSLVVRGSRDPIVPQPWAELAAKLLPQGRLIVIDKAPHALNNGAAPQLVEVVRPFLFES